MPSKYQEYRQMADTAERQLTSSYKSWTQFLRTAARLYKYPYNEQVMIHAQRPDATACAEYDFWNKKMGRFVRRGSTGIALIDTSGQKPQLRYVFDMADTGEREHSRPMHLWQFRAEHEDAVAAALERSYGVSGKDGIVEQMESAAAKLAREYWADYKRDILHNIDDSYLDGYDEFNTEVQFRNAAKVSIPMHVNKGKTIAQCLTERTDYAKNPDKTEDGEYISAYACDAKTADSEFLLSKRQYRQLTGREQASDVIAYQIRQSFKPGEVTPEEANQLGYEFARRFTKGDHAFSNAVIEHFKSYAGITALTKEISTDLLHSVTIYPDGRMNIRLNLADEIKALMETLRRESCTA